MPHPGAVATRRPSPWPGALCRALAPRVRRVRRQVAWGAPGGALL